MSRAWPVTKIHEAPTLPNLFDFDRDGLTAYLAARDESNPAARAAEIIKHVHHYGNTDLFSLLSVRRDVREDLTENFRAHPLEVLTEDLSADGTVKWVFRLTGGQAVETVYIPEGERGTVCVSSQVGCALDCHFCSTAQQGFNRNLTTGEIIGQLWHVNQRLRSGDNLLRGQLRNVVMMGMGEPLLNLEPVLKAMNLMMDDFAYNLSKYRVTLSTSGVAPKIIELAKRSQASLALSLHAPNDRLRSQIMPINRKYPLAVLLDACHYYINTFPKRHITIEYVMLAGVNDTLLNAEELIELLAKLPVKINLIPFNPFPGANFECSTPAQIHAFQKKLSDAGFNTIVRKTRGEDIDAACGQLVGKVLARGRHKSKENDQ